MWEQGQALISFTKKVEGFSLKCLYHRFCITFIKIWQNFNLGIVYQLALTTQRGSLLWVSKTLETMLLKKLGYVLLKIILRNSLKSICDNPQINPPL